MKLRSAAALAFLALAGCKPAVKGLCSATADCRPGAYCSLDGICLASSGTCAPACGDGEICSGSTCAALKPVVSVVPPTGSISPAFPHVTVHVDAAAAITLKSVAVEVDSSSHALASGSIDGPQAGDNVVTLGPIEAGAVGSVSVRATLSYLPAGATAEQTVASVAVPANIDAQAPSVSIFVPPAADEKNGWVPRTSAALEVRATVDDGAGSGAQSATLSFSTCPAAVACTYAGTVFSQSGGSTVFSFLVPRLAQAAGSEAPLAVTVTALDAAGNQGQATGALQIDDAPPQIDSFTLVSTGVNGEDGKIWFAGGAGALDVEIAVPVADSGAGVSTVTLHLTDTDVGGPDPTPSPQADGVHFLLPASRVPGREGGMHFTITATDLLAHSITPPASQIQVDAALPHFTVPHVVYSSASPASACGPADGASFTCGRRTASHVLRDDTVTVTFDGYDCGSGLVNSGTQFALNVTSGGQTKPVVATQVGKENTDPCGAASSNRLHHFSAQLNLGDAVVALDPPDSGGTAKAALASAGADRAGNTAHSAVGTTSPDGIALISLWRWKVQPSSANASGSPALLPGTPGSRTVVMGTTQSGSAGTNLYAIGPDGTQAWSATLQPSVVGDVAVGQGGTVYASTDATCGAATSCTAVNAIQPPAGTSTAAPVQCAASNANFGAPPAVATSGGSDLLYAIALSHGATGSNLFAFSPGATCTLDNSVLLTTTTTDATGVSTGSAGISAAFVATGAGFTSVDQSGNGFGTQVAYGGAAVVTKAPPSVSTSGTVGGAIFGTGGGDQKLRRTTRQPGCGAGALSQCWQTAAGFPQTPSTAPANLNFTPVFDGSTIWTIDDQGVVFTWAQLDGAPGPLVDLGEAASPPVLVQGSAALVTTVSGLVKLISNSASPMPALRLVDVSGGGNFVSKVPAPVLDCRNASCTAGGVAYVPAPGGWLWAVQLLAAPVAASATVWPRPGHDSCNTRNGAEAWCP